ncbi:MAG: hypothetical protein CMJ86_01660 [Planctomycetes bacterium]|nr:hypothetical protein [Planctomycetota bacterium]
MQLPFQIFSEPPTERIITVDGTGGAPGLELSHWPGNSTPTNLRHDLSTGIALGFSALPREERARLSEGCVAVGNNHYDTDGVLAALSILQGEWALSHSEALLGAAAAGDFFSAPTEESLMLDAAITNLVNPDRSDVDLGGMSLHERYSAASWAAFERIPGWLDGGLEQDTSLWGPELAAWRADKDDLQHTQHDDLVHLDFSIWNGSPDQASSRPGARGFDPGRHALWTVSPADRVLVLGPSSAGTLVRFLISTASWFDLVTRKTQPRPDLAALAAELNELEGCTPSDDHHWRHQDPDSPCPELWFGGNQTALFLEHAEGALRPSGIDPQRIKQVVTEAVRQAWIFEEDENGDWQI